jgi:hypothetical protein
MHVDTYYYVYFPVFYSHQKCGSSRTRNVTRKEKEEGKRRKNGSWRKNTLKERKTEREKGDREPKEGKTKPETEKSKDV